MASTTPIYAWPYQDPTDPPDGADLGQDLALAIEGDLAATDAEVAALDARLDVTEQRLVYRHTRTTTAGPTSGTTSLGVIRIDNMALKAGHAYLVLVGNLRPDLSVPGDLFKFELRYNSAGVATTSSTEIGRSESNVTQDTDNIPPPTGQILPGSNTTVASVLLTMIRPTGSGTVTLVPDTGGVFLWVIDMGTAPSDTGVDV